jgi:predicted porin
MRGRMGTLGGLALAAALLWGQAAAQSSQVQGSVSGDSFTLFGVADVYVGFGDGSLGHRTQLLSGGNTASRLGFRGLADLGGGLAAGFWLEAGLNIDNGSTGTTNTNNQADGNLSGFSFNRRATVSLVDYWGEIRLGRDFNPSYRNRDNTDPFTANGVGATQVNVGTLGGPTATRVSNMIEYLLPGGLGGFFGEAAFFLGENVQSTGLPSVDDGNGYAVRGGWAGGPFAIALSFGSTQYTQTATTGDIDVWNLGVAYDFKVVKISAGYFEDKVKQFVALKGTGYIVGAVVPLLGYDQLKIAYSSYGTDAPGDPRADKIALGYVYNFSRRTAAYATYAYLRNDGGFAFALNGSLTAPDRHSQGVDFGLKHSF